MKTKTTQTTYKQQQNNTIILQLKLIIQYVKYKFMNKLFLQYNQLINQGDQ